MRVHSRSRTHDTVRHAHWHLDDGSRRGWRLCCESHALPQQHQSVHPTRPSNRLCTASTTRQLVLGKKKTHRDRQMDRQTDRQTDTHTHTYTHTLSLSLSLSLSLCGSNRKGVLCTEDHSQVVVSSASQHRALCPKAFGGHKLPHRMRALLQAKKKVWGGRGNTVGERCEGLREEENNIWC